MTRYEAFSCLGIPVTKDAASVKTAYQKLVAKHHPEVDPEGFMRLHQAYKTALAYAQGKDSPQSMSGGTIWKPERTGQTREETGYDSLFDDLDGQETVDMARQKKVFSREVLKLKLHWLPIPLKRWQIFFSGEAYQLCRGDRDSMARLFEVVEEKIHTYEVFRFLIDRLWELDSWQKSEDLEPMAQKTRKCIGVLKEQYGFYLKHTPAAGTTGKIRSAMWYYQAMPFYFKLIVSIFPIPVLSFGSLEAMVLLIFLFYIVEVCVWYRKYNRQLGIFRLTMRLEKGGVRYRRKGDNELLAILTIFAVVMHMAGCLALFEEIAG